MNINPTKAAGDESGGQEFVSPSQASAKPKSSDHAEESRDVVIPVRYFDDSPGFRSFVLRVTLVFDDVLNCQKLRGSLEALACQDGWRHIGARLRRSQAGRLEYHIPAEFSAERPAIRYTHDHFDISAAEHPIASRLPEANSNIATWIEEKDIKDLSYHPSHPKSLQNYLRGDEPQLGLHITSFTDTTLVTLIWPHTLFDAMGLSALLHSWTLMMQERPPELPKAHPLDTDPLSELGRHVTEPYRLQDYQMSIFSLICYFARNLRSLWTSHFQRKLINVPAVILRSLRDTALNDIRHLNQPEEPFLSEGDVLVALWARLAIAQSSSQLSRTVVVNNLQSLRPILSGNLLHPDTDYTSNAIQLLPVLLTVGDVMNKTLGFVALQIRQSIETLGQRAQVEAYASLWRNAPGKLFPLFGTSDMLAISCSNWAKAKLFETNFAEAVDMPPNTRPKTHDRVGKPRFVYYDRLCPTALFGNSTLVVMGKDSDGSYWLDATADKGHWQMIEEGLEKLNKDCTDECHT